MEETLNALLPEIVSSNFEMPDVWHNHKLTQGNGHDILKINSIREKKTDMLSMIQEISNNSHEALDIHDTADTRRKKSAVIKKDTKLFVDVLAPKIDEMFQMYPYETKRAIRNHLRERLIDWVAKNARVFFGPSTSRAISACLRGQGIVMADVERFAEFVSFMLDGPVKAGIKIVVWHGYVDKGREPICELMIKPQGVFVSTSKID